MSYSGTGTPDFLLRASARFSSRNASVFIAIISLLLYMASDFFSKEYLSDVGVAWISLFRFASGLPLLFFTRIGAFKKRKVMIFAGANVLNSVCGVYAIIGGSLGGFALAGQLRPAFIIVFSVLLYRYRCSLKSWICFLSLLVISGVLFTKETGFGQQANLIYVFSVAFQAFVFAGIGRKTEESLISFLAVYNVCGFVLTSLFIILTGENFPNMSFLPLLVSNGLLAMLGSILNIISLASDYKVQVSAVSYVRLPLTLFLSWVFLHEQLTSFIWMCTASIILLVFLLGKSSVNSSNPR